MSKRNKIGQQVILEMNNFLLNEKHVGQIANSIDMEFIADGAWLKDAAVIDVIKKNKGAWDLYLIFAHYKNPLQLIVRNITTYFGEEKAKAAALYIRKGASKDRRGTLSVSIKHLNLCNN